MQSNGKGVPSAQEVSSGFACFDCVPALRNNNERQGFVRKVYALLFVQLGITTIFVAAGVVSEEFRDFIEDNQWLYILTIAVTGVICLMLFCFYKWFKAVPLNYILLFVFVIAESYSVTVITCYYKPSSVLICSSIALAMTFTMSIYACFTTNDFTKWYSGLFWALLGALIASIFFVAFYPNRYILIIVVSIYLIADTQAIIGGGKYSISYDDYVVAVMLLYTDIITIFVNLLSLFGERRD
eukprot:TRINITY_DN6800_c0_g2_i5.p1 TRINITY_DN6800_c0_g2~~TRINITY_DN6800_c0_g2_i5.p1  ORF type:complete len:241 (+),score=40.91 TRINITY_DN6800_c0_g2_i5:158-880(+)